MTPFRSFVRNSAAGRVLLMPWRLKNALRTTLRPVGRAIGWTFSSREHYNYSYDLQPLNVEYLAAFVSVVTSHAFKTVRNYIVEIDSDEALKTHDVNLNRKQ